MPKQLTQVKLEDIEKHIEALSKIGNLGDSPEDGFLRASWSKEETRAMLHVARTSGKGFNLTRTDEVGNFYIRTCGDHKKIIQVGSHLDTVPEGGNYDGAAGVIAGLEAMKLIESWGLSKGLELVMWRGEESGTFGSVYKGSKAAFGIADPKILQNTFNGQTLEEAILNEGLYPGYLEKGAPTITQEHIDSINAHLELHIEQGRVLEESGVDIGIVTSIRGPARYRVIVEGEFDHSGNTPMGIDYRKDANLAIAYMQVRLDELAQHQIERGMDLVQTVGVVNSDREFNKKHPEIYTNALTKVSGSGYFTLDIRSNSNKDKKRYEEAAQYLIRQTAVLFGVHVEIQKTGSSPALESLDSEIQNIIESSCEKLGYSSMRMASGAGHDAAIVAQQYNGDGIFIPTGMIFIPCRNGKSHCKEEYASPEAITKGANVLAQTLYQLAK